MAFGDRLRELRESAGLTQQGLGEQIGVTWQNVSRWERNERVPSWEYIQALADALGVTCEAFREEPSPEAATPRKPGRPRKDQSSTVVVDPGPTAGQEGREDEEREERDERDDDPATQPVEEGGPQAEQPATGRPGLHGKVKGRKRKEEG